MHKSSVSMHVRMIIKMSNIKYPWIKDMLRVWWQLDHVNHYYYRSATNYPHLRIQNSPTTYILQISPTTYYY